ncbi:MAG TPA: rhodanese-like domain-containing protein [Coleofasciculaceae cyanobacterium]|jgi:rhodanese-related sulfurtransferase
MAWMGRSLIFSLLKGFIRIKFPHVQHMTTVEFAQKLEDAAEFCPVILDARSDKEYAVSHLAAARRVEISSYLSADQVSTEQALKEVSKHTPIVVYCSVGYRSAKVAQQLTQAGFSAVFNLEGGVFQWVNEDRFLMHNGLPTQRVHPYSAVWGALLEHRRSRI